MMATMMRNLVLIGAILLSVSASASVCEFWKSKSPVSVLNEYLTENVASDDFADNMKAIVKYEPGQKDKKVEQLASLLTKLDTTFDPENLCTESNLKTIRETFEAVHSYDKESFKEPKLKIRLNRLLFEYFDEAFEICVRYYEGKWDRNYPKLKKLGLKAYIWLDVDRLTQRHAFRFRYDSSDESSFRGAFRLLQGKWKPSKEELKEAFTEMQERMDSVPYLRAKLRAAKGEKPPIDVARELVSTYLYKPCKVLMNNDKAQTILGSITDLAAAYLLSGNNKHIWMVIMWAGRSYFCKWALDKSVDKLAKMML